MNEWMNYLLFSDQGHVALSALGTAVGLTLLIVGITKFGKRLPPLPPGPVVIKEWTWTGHVNAIGDSQDDDAQCDWKILVEDHRIVSDIADGELIEVRWRGPTRKEMREIVRIYNMRNENGALTLRN